MATTQEHTLRAFTALHLLAPQVGGDWHGKVIASVGMHAEGAALALASHFAGAACLIVEARPPRLKAALRSGCCDFMVNNLDEALRVMKNEVRKRRPISVGLLGNAATVLPEMVERGVLPEMLVEFAESRAEAAWNTPIMDEAVRALKQMGACVADFNGEVADLLEAFLRERGWTMATRTAADAEEMQKIDAKALALLPQEDAMRRQWMEAALKYFRRELPLRRVLWMTAEEAAQWS